MTKPTTAKRLAEMLKVELDLLKMAVNADDPKKEILIRIEDMERHLDQVR